MMRFLAGGILLLSVPAAADVHLGTPVIEVSGQYVSMPAAMLGANEPVVGTGIHVIDRNGLYTAFVAGVLGAKCTGSCASSVTWTTVTDEGMPGGIIVITKETYVPTEEPEEDRQAREDAQRAIGMGTSTYTELAVYRSVDGTSELSGASFGMGAALFGNTRFAVDVGLRWQRLEAEACGPTAQPTTCTRRFLGVPARFIFKLGRVGGDVGFAWNWRKDGSFVDAGLAVDVHDRLFVRGGVLARAAEITRPAFVVDLGLRL
jgi:hypothetical protein